MKYKVFFTFIFFIVLIFFSANDSKATTILGEEFPEFPTDVPSEYQYTYITYDHGEDYYFLFYTYEPAIISTINNHDGLVHYIVHFEANYKYIYYPETNQTSWEFVRTGPYDNNYVYINNNGSYLDYSDQVVYASESIYYDLDSSSDIQELDGDVFFYGTPSSKPLSTMWPIGTGLWQFIAKTLLVVIPIIVIYIAIRKGISFVRTNLSNS